MQTIKQRLNFIDNAKFIGIYLVILGHTPIPEFLHVFIFTFHIPLFFLISGMLFSFNRFPDYLSFLKHRSKQLLIAYLTFNVITYLFWFFIGRKFGEDIGLNIPYYKPLIGIFYGNGINYYLQHCTPIWFIACLFAVENIYYLVFKRIGKRWLLLLAFAAIGFADSHFNLTRLPWGINIAFTAIVFYGIGNIFKIYLTAKLNLRMISLIALGCLSLAITVFAGYLNGDVDMNNRIYNNYLYLLIGGLSGAFFVLIVSRIFEMLFGRVKFIEFIAMNTIFLIAFQGINSSLIKGISLFIFKLPLSVYIDKIGINLAFSVVSMLFTIPIIYVFDRYLPFLVGRSKPRPS